MEEKNNKLIFQVESALNGVTVELTQKKFDEHIVTNHPEMKGHEKDIEKTIINPTIIRQAKIKPKRRFEFIRKVVNNKEVSAYNNVMVEYNDESKKTAHVVTSFYSDDIGKGGGECVYFKYNNNI